MNHATRTITATLGVIFAIGGMSHGFFEILQGNTPTNGLIIDAISESMRRWPHGSETAFTLIPNFLVTGIAAIGVSLAIIVWSLGYLHTKHGATIYLLLFILLFLVGGGIGQIVFFTVGWAFATRINKPLTWWRKALPEGVRGTLARVWPWSLAVSTVLVLFALEIAIFGYVPGVEDADQRLSVVFASLGVGLALLILSFVSGFADDIQRQSEPQIAPTMSRRQV
jgi:hypothetical protein